MRSHKFRIGICGLGLFVSLAQSYATQPPVPACDIVSKKAWNDRYTLPYGGWFDANDPENARKNYLYIGPLGVRTLAHVRERMAFKGYAAIAPKVLTDEAGDLVANCLEVLYVAPGSPADGHLREGDLVLQVDGEPLLSGNAYRPDKPFHSKGRRTVKVHVGERVDRAEARGAMTLRVLRLPATGADDLPRPPKQRVNLQPAIHLAEEQTDTAIEVDVSAVREIMLLAGEGGDGKNGDGTAWVEPIFTMEDGSKQQATLQPWLYANCGYGSLQVAATPEGYEALSGGRPRTNTIMTHATSEIAYRVPDGAVWFKTTAVRRSYGAVEFSVEGVPRHTDSAIPAATLRHAMDVEITLPRIGSFAKNYPGNCSKSEWIVKQNVNWLLAQQQPDGSWPRWAGYTTEIFDTGIVGLALLATGDPALDEPIRRAAHYVAYEGSYDHWGTPRATALLFLAEYYLRTEDASILPGMEQACRRVSETILHEGFVGHGTRHVGYGYGGVCMSTGHAATALAVASRTPVTMDRGALRTLLNCIASLSIDGALPYGRISAKPRTGQHGAQRGGYARTGPALIASIIGGGSERFIREAGQMYRDTLGYADMAHASQTIGWWGTTYGLPASDRETFHKHMEIFKHKVTLLRCWEGGFLANEFPFDLMVSEGVMGGLFRTAVYVLALCADRQNLLITGKPGYRAGTHLAREPSHNWDNFTYRYYLQNWAVADAYLGAHSPDELKRGLAAIRKLEPGDDLHRELFSLVDGRVEAMVDSIMNIPELTARQRAHAVELVLGMDFRIHAEAGDDRKTQSVSVDTYWPLRERLRRATDDERKAYAAAQPFPVKGSITVVDSDSVLDTPLAFEFDSTEGKSNWDEAHTRLNREVAVADRPEEFALPLQIAYTVGPHRIAYRRDLPFNRAAADVGRRMRSADRRIPVEGRLVRDVIGQEVVLEMDNGVILDLMTPEGHKTALPLRLPGGTQVAKGDWGGPQEGDRVLIDYVSADIHTGVCMRMAVLDSAVERIVPVAVTTPRSGLRLPESLAPLHDDDLATSYAVDRTGRGETNIVLEVDFGRVQKVNGVGFWADGVKPLQVHAEVDGETRFLHSGPTRHTLRFPSIRTDRLTLTLSTTDKIAIKELKITNNPRRTSAEQWVRYP